MAIINGIFSKLTKKKTDDMDVKYDLVLNRIPREASYNIEYSTIGEF